MQQSQLFIVFRILLLCFAPSGLNKLLLLLVFFPEITYLAIMQITLHFFGYEITGLAIVGFFVFSLSYVLSSVYFLIAVIQNLIGFPSSLLLAPLAALESATPLTYVYHLYISTQLPQIQYNSALQPITSLCLADTLQSTEYIENRKENLYSKLNHLLSNSLNILNVSRETLY